MSYSEESEMPSSSKEGHQRHEKKQRLRLAGASLSWHSLLEGRGQRALNAHHAQIGRVERAQGLESGHSLPVPSSV